jgi:hypothetical protein
LAGRARRRPSAPRKTATLSDGCNANIAGDKSLLRLKTAMLCDGQALLWQKQSI